MPGLRQCTHLFLDNLKLSPWPKAKILQISRGKCPWTDESVLSLLSRFQVSGRARYPTSDRICSWLRSSCNTVNAHRQKSVAESATSCIKFSYTTQWVLLLTAAAATPSVLPQLVRHTLSEVPAEEGAAETSQPNVISNNFAKEGRLKRFRRWKWSVEASGILYFTSCSVNLCFK